MLEVATILYLCIAIGVLVGAAVALNASMALYRDALREWQEAIAEHDDAIACREAAAADLDHALRLADDLRRSLGGGRCVCHLMLPEGACSDPVIHPDGHCDRCGHDPICHVRPAGEGA